MCLRGLPAFQDRTEAVFRDAEAQRDLIHNQLTDIAPIKWTSHPQTAKFLGIQSTRKEVLATCTHPAAPLLRSFRRLSALIPTIFEKSRGTPRVHGLITLGGSKIGRTSSDHINIQNIPRDVVVRCVFGCPESDWVKLDFAHAELMVAATLAGCSSLLEAFRTGRSPHVETASRISGVPPDAVTKEQRTLGKLLNFAMLYGAGPWKIVEEAEAAGIKLTVAEAETFRRQWFQAYPEIKTEQDATRQRLFRGEAITSAYARRWSIACKHPRGWNQALQAPVASTASDLLLLSLDAVWDRLEAIGSVVNLVHDEIDVLIPKGAWPDLASEFRQIALTMAGMDSRFPMHVEVSMGPDWGSTVKQFVAGGKAS